MGRLDLPCPDEGVEWLERCPTVAKSCGWGAVLAFRDARDAQLWLLKRTRQRDARPNTRADIHEAFLQIAGCRVKRS
jgi:hypothetical protein